MTSALATMRVDYDQVKIKDLKTSNNRLLNKRRKKQKQAGTSSAAPGCNNQWQEKPRTCGWEVKTKRNNLRSVWSTQSVPQRQSDREEAILQRGSSVKNYIFITWIKALLLKANVYDMILLHIAREGTVIPEMLRVFVLALTASDERREQEAVSACWCTEALTDIYKNNFCYRFKLGNRKNAKSPARSVLVVQTWVLRKKKNVTALYMSSTGVVLLWMHLDSISC